MAVRLRRARDADFDEILQHDMRSFAFTTTAEEREFIRAMLDLDRFHVVTDGGRIVGVAGSFGQELTVPGPVQVSCGGVTWVSVAATHRRRGLLRRLMAAVHADIDERGEVVGALKRTGRDVAYCNLESDQGHDSFLLRGNRLGDVVGGFLERVSRGANP